MATHAQCKGNEGHAVDSRVKISLSKLAIMHCLHLENMAECLLL